MPVWRAEARVWDAPLQSAGTWAPGDHARRTDLRSPAHMLSGSPALPSPWQHPAQNQCTWLGTKWYYPCPCEGGGEVLLAHGSLLGVGQLSQLCASV